MAPKRKPSLGRQKIAMEKIPKKNHLQVTFSKRRAGLFKKASELCTLCGVDVAIIVFSPADKAFSFGHPNVDSIVERFFTKHPPPTSGAHQLIEAHRNANVRELNWQLGQVLSELEEEGKKGETLNAMRKESQSQYWWASPIENLGLHELQPLKVALEELKKNLTKQANQVLVESTNNHPFIVMNGATDFGSVERKPNEIINPTTFNTIDPDHVNNFGNGNGFF